MPPARPMVVDPGSYKANTEPQPLYRWDVGQAFQPDSPTPRRGLADDVRLESLTYAADGAVEEREQATRSGRRVQEAGNLPALRVTGQREPPSGKPMAPGRRADARRKSRRVRVERANTERRHGPVLAVVHQPAPLARMPPARPVVVDVGRYKTRPCPQPLAAARRRLRRRRAAVGAKKKPEVAGLGCSLPA
jgi:hypothetical protein